MAQAQLERPLPLVQPRLRAGWLRPGLLAMAGVSLVVAYLVLGPLVVLVLSSFRRYRLVGGIEFELTLDNYQTAYLNPAFLEILGNSLLYAAGGSLVALLFGTLVAWLVERTNVPCRGAFGFMTIATYFVPGVLSTIAWILLLSPRIGVFNNLLRLVVPVSEGPLNVNSMGGMIWVFGAHMYPLVFLVMSAAFRSMDPALEEAAALSGAGLLASLRRVTLGISRPALISAVLIMLVRALESFEVPLLLGVPGKVRVLTTEIYGASQRQPPELGVSAAFGMLLLALSVAGVWLYRRATARAERFATVTGKGYRPRQLDLGRWRWPIGGLACLFFLATFAAPLLALVWISLFRFVTQPSLQALGNVSLFNYQFVARYPAISQAFQNSILNAVLAASAVVVITGCLAWITLRVQLPGRWMLDGLAFLPIAIPGTIIGVSVLLVYLTLPVPLYGTLLLITIAHVTMYLPYGMRLLSDALLRVHRELEEAASLSGASWLDTARRILVPLLVPGIVAAWVYIVTVSFRELSAAIFLTSPQSRVVSVVVFSLWQDGNVTTTAALGIVVLVVLAVLALVANRLGVALGATR
ncbi:MAG TPA: iron ABC transporter permease [Chloroflexota bacterium]|nr:iron ABC transporter permease [Chloroflexota bacterium]